MVTERHKQSMTILRYAIGPSVACIEPDRSDHKGKCEVLGCDKGASQYGRCTYGQLSPYRHGVCDFVFCWVTVGTCRCFRLKVVSQGHYCCPITTNDFCTEKTTLFFWVDGSSTSNKSPSFLAHHGTSTRLSGCGQTSSPTAWR